MDRYRGGGSFLGPARAWGGKDHHVDRLLARRLRAGEFGLKLPGESKRSASALEFSQFAIVSPANDQTITGNQPVTVQLAIEPELKPTQSIAWYLNGSPVANQASTQFTLEDLPRGTYTLGATVTDQASGESKSVDPVTFYVVRTSLFSPQHKAT